MKLNPEIVQKRCEDIAESLERLDKIKKIGKKDFLKDRDLQDIASYRLLVAIEAALNLCYHVSAKKMNKVPGAYTECFGMLNEEKIIPGKLSKNLRNMARFRNMLVHMYWDIDYEIVYDIIQNNLDDIRLFSNKIASLLTSEKKKESTD